MPKFKTLDYILLTIAGLFSLFVCWRIYALQYHWNWQVLPSYIVKHDPQTGAMLPGLILEGLFVTLKISIYATIIAVLIGFTVGLFRVSPRLFFRLTGRSYVELIRNLPALVLVFIFYYFISDQILAAIGLENMIRSASENTQAWLEIFFSRPGLITQFLSGVLTLGLFQGAYIAEIVRGGIESVDTGQWEAGAALGLTRRQQLRKIILPQALKIMLPQLANEFINTIKWSSIVSIISIQELTYNGIQIIASTGATIEVWSVVALIYLVLCLILSIAVRLLEKYYKTRGWDVAGNKQQ